jgi:hypothetical protein
MEMIEAFSNIATSLGLSASAGLNAYLPLLVVALTARFFPNLIALNEPWDVLTSWWIIGALVVLLAIEMTVDKIPAVDSINDIVIQTFVRPVAGAILFAASSNVIADIHPVLAMICGLILAGGVHAAKTTVRPLVTGASGGTLNPVVSLAEDIASLAASLLAILVPILILLLLLLAFLLGLLWYRRRKVQNSW